MRKIGCGLLVLISLTLSAQTITTSLSNEFELREMPFCKAGNSFYFLDIGRPRAQIAFSVNFRKALHGLTVLKYDASMKELKQEPLEGGKNVFGYFISRLVSFNNRLLLFYYKLQDNDDMILYMSHIDTGTLAVTHTEELRTFYKSEVNYHAGLLSDPENNQDALYTAPSPDSSKLLVMSAKPGKLFSCIIGKDGKATGSKLTDLSGVPGFNPFSGYLDNEGNRYLSYKLEKKNIRGVYMQNTAGRESFQEYKLKEPYSPNDIIFKQLPYSQKVYLYAGYCSKYLCEGICLAALSPATLTIAPTQLLAYPEAFCKRAEKMGFGEKKKGVYTVRETGYQLGELADGTLAFIGTPTFTEFHPASNGGGRSIVYTGPVLYGMVKGDKAVFDMVPRNQLGSPADAIIPIVRGNELLCLYADKEGSIEKPANDDPPLVHDFSSLALALCTINSEGVITGRKKILDNPEGKNNLALNGSVWLPDNRLVIPLYREKRTMKETANYYRQFLTLNIQ